MNSVSTDIEKKYSKLMGDVKGHANIRYAAYRTAMKLRTLQTGLGFNTVRLSTINGVLVHHKLFYTNHSIHVNDNDLDAVLSDILFATAQDSKENINIDLSVALTTKFLKHVYKLNENDCISVLNLKVALVCLCASPLQAKYQYWFQQMADYNLCLTPARLKSLLESMLSIPVYLEESNMFGRHFINPMLESCFTEDNRSLGINETAFMCWVTQEPQLLVWLSTLYRMRSSENVIHRVECAVCKVSPIKGLRYTCLRCISYDMCQMCFFTAGTSKRHKASHRIREYCSKISACDAAISFIRNLLNRFGRNSPRMQYLPAVRENSDKCLSSNANINESIPLSTRKTLSCGSPEFNPSKRMEDRLQEIILQIERESSLLTKQTISEPQIIQEHANFLKEHLERLKTLKKEIEEENSNYFMSTPVNGGKHKDVFGLSPIARSPNCLLSPPSPSGFSTWLLNKDVDEEDSLYVKQLQSELDDVMKKLNVLIDTHLIDDNA